MWLKIENPLCIYLGCGHRKKAEPRWAPLTAIRYKELGLLISAREVGLPISLTLTDSVKH